MIRSGQIPCRDFIEGANVLAPLCISSPSALSKQIVTFLHCPLPFAILVVPVAFDSVCSLQPLAAFALHFAVCQFCKIKLFATTVYATVSIPSLTVCIQFQQQLP